jgi:hypothetical protein
MSEKTKVIFFEIIEKILKFEIFNFCIFVRSLDNFLHTRLFENF